MPPILTKFVDIRFAAGPDGRPGQYLGCYNDQGQPVDVGILLAARDKDAAGDPGPITLRINPDDLVRPGTTMEGDGGTTAVLGQADLDRLLGQREPEATQGFPDTDQSPEPAEAAADDALLDESLTNAADLATEAQGIDKAADAIAWLEGAESEAEWDARAAALVEAGADDRWKTVAEALEG